MNTSFYNGISGVKTHQFGLDVWADNISNIGTTGFKSATPEFSTQFATTLTDAYFDPTTNNGGLGSQAQGTALNMSQGIFQPTDNVFDLSIGGEGWFGVQGNDNQTYYTRAGAFSVDAQGNMVDGAGNYLLGTSGGNITPAILSQEKLQEFGQYYRVNTQELGEPYSISRLDDITLSAVDTQNKINLPDILYFPPEATTYVNYQANLDPKIKTETNITNVNTDNNINITRTYPTISITGTMANDTQIDNLKEGDEVTLTLFDDANNLINLTTTLDSNLDFSITSADISSLEDSPVTLNQEISVTQEIANVEHFTTEIISPDGNKDFIDMTFTKRVPQQNLETTWDADIQILRYVEDYEIQAYNPNITYDPAIYDVDLNTNQVKKIYDPSQYKVDLGQNKVYEIIDSQSGSATFGGAGELLSSNIPTLSNSGQTLDLNIGTPYEQQNIPISSITASGSNLIISGSSPSLPEGASVNINITDIDGTTITTSARVQSNGTWQSTYENNPLDMSNPLSSSAYNVINNGYDGMVSHVDLEKNRLSEKDGYIEGLLKEYGMDSRGNIVAEFSNGRSTPVAKVALYHFQNDQGLEKITSTMFAKSSNSGEAIFYTDENGNPTLGSKVYSNRLEGSNVNMATALTELIVMQKAFDASAKSITTSNELIQNAIQMKR